MVGLSQAIEDQTVVKRVGLVVERSLGSAAVPRQFGCSKPVPVVQKQALPGGNSVEGRISLPKGEIEENIGSN